MAASLINSLAGLVSFGLTVTGIGTQSYDLKTFFEAKQAGSLAFPCLLAVAELGEQTGWQTLGMMGNAPKLDFIFEQYLLYSPVAGAADITVILPTELALIDNYFLALKALPNLTPNSAPSTHQPSKVAYRIAKSNWYGIQYHSICFRHKLELNL